MPVGRPPRFLIVDDDPVALGALRQLLRARHPKWQVISATSLVRARDLFSRYPFEVVVTELTLKDGSATELLADAERLPHPPVCLLHTKASNVVLGPLLRTVVHRVLPKPAEDLALFTAIVTGMRLRAERARVHRANRATS